MFDNAKNKIDANIVPGKKEGTSAAALKEVFNAVIDDTREAVGLAVDNVSPISIKPTTPLNELNTLPNAVYRAFGEGTYQFNPALQIVQGSAVNVIPPGYSVKFLKDASGWSVSVVEKMLIQDISEIKEITDKFKSTLSVNLFPKDYPYKVNSYVDYTTGNIYDNNEFDVFKVEVKSDIEYTIKYSHQIAFFDSNNNFIQGFYDYPDERVVILFPTNTKYILISVPHRLISNQMVVLGRHDLNEYVAPIYGSNNIGVFYRNVVNKPNQVVVGTNGDYSTINEALDNIQDNIFNQYSILLMPGEYNESVNLIGRYISIIGVDKYKCQISTYTNDYEHPPIDLGPNSNVSNCTIIVATNSSTPANGVNNLPAYGIHFDLAARYDWNLPENQGRSVVHNCRIISNYTHAVGIGLTPNSELIFDCCEFYSPVNSVFRAHNYIYSGGNQHLIVRNSDISNAGYHKPIVFQDTNNGVGSRDNTDTVFTFKNNIVYNDNGILNYANAIDSDYLPPIGEGTVAGKIIRGKSWYGNSFDD